MVTKDTKIDNNRKLRLIGILPKYLDEKTDKLSKHQINRVPFTSQYKTYQDYENDLYGALNMSHSKEIPDSLIEKILKAQKELGIGD